ncbi:MAG: hypothetical protein ACLP5V_12600 [Candidatus Bathyarchaeia archaeon]
MAGFHLRLAWGFKFTLLSLMIILAASSTLQNVHAATPIVFDSSGSPNPQTCFSTCNVISWSHTVGSGSNGILLVGLSHDTRFTASSVTFGATPLTLIGDHFGSFVHVELWALLNPTAGSGTITVTFSAILESFVGGSVSYFNVASTISQLQAAATANDGSTATASDTVATSPGDLVVDTLAVANLLSTSTVSPTGSGRVQRWNSGPVGLGFAGAGSDQPASGSSVTMSWSISQGGILWSLVAIPLTPVTTPISEYPLGLPLLAILTIIGYGLVKRRTRSNQN